MKYLLALALILITSNALAYGGHNGTFFHSQNNRLHKRLHNRIHPQHTYTLNLK